jgi:DNA polymerase III delta subunit
MLILLYGKSESMALQKANTWKNKILNKRNISNISFIDKNIESEDFATLANDISIFGDIFAFFVKLKKDEILDEKELEEIILSPNLFAIFTQNEELRVVVENMVGDEGRNLPKANFALETVDEEVREFFPSHFVEAMQKKDKKNAWKILLELLKEKPAEEVVGVCIFAYKTLYAAATFTSNSANSGIKDFPFNNAKRNLKFRKNSSLEEIENIYFNLLKTFASSRRDGAGLGESLEKWVLEN